MFKYVIVCLALFQSHIAVNERTNLRYNKLIRQFQKITKVLTNLILYYYYFPHCYNIKVIKTMK